MLLLLVLLLVVVLLVLLVVLRLMMRKMMGVLLCESVVGWRGSARRAIDGTCG